MSLKTYTFLVFFSSILLGCSTPNAIRLAPEQSGGWRKDNIMVLYQNQYPATQMTQMLISNGINGWEKVDFKHQNGQVFEIMSHSQLVVWEKDNSQRKVSSYLSLQLKADQSIQSVAYWHDEQPAVWETEKLASYLKLFENSQNQALKLKEKQQRLWYGELNLENKLFQACAHQDKFELDVSEEFLSKNLKGWQRMSSKNKLWLAFIGSEGSSNEITLIEQLLAQPPRASNCLILKSVGQP